jgi:hypothetical protein
MTDDTTLVSVQGEVCLLRCAGVQFPHLHPVSIPASLPWSVPHGDLGICGIEYLPTGEGRIRNGEIGYIWLWREVCSNSAIQIISHLVLSLFVDAYACLTAIVNEYMALVSLSSSRQILGL